MSLNYWSPAGGGEQFCPGNTRDAIAGRFKRGRGPLIALKRGKGPARRSPVENGSPGRKGGNEMCQTSRLLYIEPIQENRLMQAQLFVAIWGYCSRLCLVDNGKPTVSIAVEGEVETAKASLRAAINWWWHLGKRGKKRKGEKKTKTGTNESFGW